MGGDTTDSLAARATRGDRDAFRRLVASEARLLLAVAYRYCGDWDTAADLCQETWLQVHARFDDYDPGRPFRPWLRAVHRRTCLQHLRRPSVRRERPTPTDVLYGLLESDPAPDPLTRLAADDLVAHVRRGLAVLPPRQQEVLAAVDLEQDDPAETAARLGMSWATLRTTLHFARKRLAESLRRLEVET
ncbi:RNA polymerase sigma factor [bacterium]|nr:RNA polymerase sigma factor [bacterium]MBU1676474.1 RNA polymerase sigma factor [bacterium]